LELKQGDELLGLRRQLSAFVAQRSHGRLERLRALKAEHPCWGYRRLWAYRHFVEQQAVHKNRLWRLHAALGYKPPRQFEQEYSICHGTQFPAA
jgi:transposase InsO family protein